MPKFFNIIIYLNALFASTTSYIYLNFFIATFLCFVLSFADITSPYVPAPKIFKAVYL